MHPVLKSYLSTFQKSHGLEATDDAKLFEAFCATCVLSEHTADDFNPMEFVTGDDDESVDAAVVLIDSEIAQTSEVAKRMLAPKKGAVSKDVEYVFVQAKRSPAFDLGEILKFIAGVASIVDASNVPDDPVLHEFAEISTEVTAALSQISNGRPDCKLYFVAPGEWIEDANRQTKVDAALKTIKATSLFNSVELVPVDRERLIKLWAESQVQAEAQFSVRGSLLPMPPINGVEEAYLGLVPAKEFVAKVLSDKNGKMRHAIFDQNVRAFLGEDNSVNKRISELLNTSALQSRFAVLNNGVTIVSPDVRVQGSQVSVRSFQIVNGCQTSNVLYRNAKSLADDVLVPVKVIEAQEAAVVAQIVEATNSQTNVVGTQFLSVSPFLRKVETYFEAFSYNEADELKMYFERRTKQYADSEQSAIRVFDIQRLARAFAAVFLDLPHLSASYPKKIMEVTGGAIFSDKHRELEYYTAALALYRIELLLSNKYVAVAGLDQGDLQRLKWHALCVAARKMGGKRPSLSSKKADDHCEKLLKVFSKGGKASASVIADAYGVIAKVSGATNRDRIKGQRFTSEVLDAI